jgi:hypothetical protein
MGANDMWFANRNDEGIIYHQYFNPFPVKTMALMLAGSGCREPHLSCHIFIQLITRTGQVECCIDEWITGVKEDIKFSLAGYASVYQAHLESLMRFEERTAAYKLLEKIRINLHDTARFVMIQFTHIVFAYHCYKVPCRRRVPPCVYWSPS